MRSPSRSLTGVGAPPSPPPAHERVCAATGRSLAVGDHYVAVLVHSPDADDLLRCEYAADAWAAGARPAGTLVGWWRSVVPPTDAKPRILLDNASLLELFEQMGSEIDQNSGQASELDHGRSREAFRFILALMLIRKRILVCERSEADRLFVRPKAPAGTITPADAQSGLTEVVDPGMDDATLASVTLQLAAVLSG